MASPWNYSGAAGSSGGQVPKSKTPNQNPYALDPVAVGGAKPAAPANPFATPGAPPDAGAGAPGNPFAGNASGGFTPQLPIPQFGGAPATPDGQSGPWPGVPKAYDTGQGAGPAPTIKETTAQPGAVVPFDYGNVRPTVVKDQYTPATSGEVGPSKNDKGTAANPASPWVDPNAAPWGYSSTDTTTGTLVDYLGGVVGKDPKTGAPDYTKTSGSLAQALQDALFGGGDYGLSDEALASQFAKVQKGADAAKIKQSQQLGARGFGAGGQAAADLGGLQSAAEATKADIDVQNQLAAKDARNKMVATLGNLVLGDKQVTSALENQAEADKWTGVNNILGMIGGEGASPKALAEMLGVALDDPQWKEIAERLVFDPGTGKVTGFNPAPTGPQTPGAPPSANQIEPKTDMAKFGALVSASLGDGYTVGQLGTPTIGPGGNYTMAAYGTDPNGGNVMYVLTQDVKTGQWTVTSSTPL